jgi:5-deoxy-glucuronate isomerase
MIRLSHNTECNEILPDFAPLSEFQLVRKLETKDAPMPQLLQYTSDNLLVRPRAYPHDPDLILEITPQLAGWDYISFQARRLEQGATWSFQTGENELAIINFTGRYTVETNRGRWTGIGGRTNVFSGAAHALYLPRHTDFTITAEEAGDFAVTWVPTDQDHAPWLIKPEDVPISIRGGDNASRQINDLLPPGSPVQRLVLVEVYTPSGNWSSYPGHKHDVHIEDAAGKVTEADLEEVYFYKLDKPEGYAYQRVYTDEQSPLHQAGYPIDALVCARNNDAVIVPEGYHPVTSAPGYTTYYLNVLAGSAQSLANQDDPKYAWVKQSYRRVDDRLPLY